MNKRALSKVERPEATEEMIKLAQRTQGCSYIAMAQIIDVDGEKILLLNFFRRSELDKKKIGAAFRTFIFKNDYITQDLASTRVKWKTGSLKYILGWEYRDTKKNGYDVILASDSDFISAQHYMGAYLENGDSDIWGAIMKFQDEVMDNRLKSRHKKETDKIDKKMEMIQEKPEGFEEWAHESAMEDRRYLVYEAMGRRRKTAGYCTYCKKNVMIDAKAVQPRNRKRGNCPNCGSPVTFIPKGYFPAFQMDDKWVCLIQKIPTGVVARYFHVRQGIWKYENYKEKFAMRELCRAFLEKDEKGKIKTDSYEWGVYKQHGLPRWCPDQNRVHCACAVVYTENLPEAFEGTAYQYCALDLYQRKLGCSQIPVWHFMNKYPRHTNLEMFLKAGLIKLVGEIIKERAYDINMEGKTPEDILDIPKKYISILREIDGGVDELSLLKQCASDNILPRADDIIGFCKRFGSDDELIGVVNAHMGIGKFIRYMDKQISILPVGKEPPCHAAWASPGAYSKEGLAKKKYSNLSRDWMDYIGWCSTLKHDMDDRYVLLPPDFGKAHDRVMKEYQAFQDEKGRKHQQKIEKAIKEVLAVTANIPAIRMKAKGLMIILPKSGAEIKEEGQALHHCVGNYVERVAKGETMILFVRKENEPDIPYFTLEYKDGKVAQCRGEHNCPMTKDVKAFVEAFERKMQEEGGGKTPVKERKAG